LSGSSSFERLGIIPGSENEHTNRDLRLKKRDAVIAMVQVYFENGSKLGLYKMTMLRQINVGKMMRAHVSQRKQLSEPITLPVSEL
jgi:hypothetical protein